MWEIMHKNIISQKGFSILSIVFSMAGVMVLSLTAKKHFVDHRKAKAIAEQTLRDHAEAQTRQTAELEKNLLKEPKTDKDVSGDGFADDD